MKNILTQNLVKYFLPEGQMSVNSFNKTNQSLNATRNANRLIANFFSPIDVFASMPTYTVTANHVIIHVFYYCKAGQSLNNNTINNLGEALSTLFGQPVELRLVKQYYPYLNSYILAQYIAINTQDHKLVRIVRRLFSSIGPIKSIQSIDVLDDVSLPSYIIGIKVQVSGRLMKERSRPRQTVQTTQIGSFSKNNLALVDKASYSTQNKKGAFTVKVWISQRATV